MPIYMKYEGITGPLRGKYHGWIELESCQIGVHKNPSSDKEVTSDVVVTKKSDGSTMSLLKESVQGTRKKVTIDFVANGDVSYLSVELEKTMISFYSINKGFEDLSLNFTKITYSAKAVKASYESEHARNRLEWGQYIYQNMD